MKLNKSREFMLRQYHWDTMKPQRNIVCQLGISWKLVKFSSQEYDGSFKLVSPSFLNCNKYLKIYFFENSCCCSSSLRLCSYLVTSFFVNIFVMWLIVAPTFTCVNTSFSLFGVIPLICLAMASWLVGWQLLFHSST